MKKIIISLLALTALIFNADAQFINVKLGTDMLIEDAVKDAIVLVETSYCIQDKETGQKYGRNGNSIFNSDVFFACKTSTGVMTEANAMTPWENDPAFDKYRNDSKYQPVLSDSVIIKTLKGEKVCATTIGKKQDEGSDNKLAFFPCKGAKGLKLAADNPTEFNWIIWVKEKNESEEGSSYELSVVKKTIEKTGGTPAKVEMPVYETNYFGGIYVTANVIETGTIEFTLDGLIIGDKDDWKLYSLNGKNLPKEKTKPAKPAIKEPVGATPDDELTPVSSNNIEIN